MSVPRLLWITPEAGPLDAMLSQLDAACSRVTVLLRRRATGRQLLEEGRALRAVCDRTGAALFVSARIDLARVLEAQGVHLPERGVEIADARRLFSGVIGVSRHDRAGLAAAASADYAVLSPFAATPGKGPPLGAEGFAAVLRDAPCPVLALGGITPRNASEALRAGAHGLAAIRGILEHGPTPFLSALDSAGSAQG